jgi:hypothetical protein
MVKGNKYYIVTGQTWHNDFTGKYSIQVLEYESTYGEKDYGEKEIKGKLYYSFFYSKNTKISEPNLYINNGDTDVTTGTGADPVYVVVEWKKGFTPLSDLPKAQLWNNNNNNKIKTERPSPTESATLYKIGTKKKGNDGNIWIIVETINGVKKWKKHRIIS